MKTIGYLIGGLIAMLINAMMMGMVFGVLCAILSVFFGAFNGSYADYVALSFFDGIRLGAFLAIIYTILKVNLNMSKGV